MANIQFKESTHECPPIWFDPDRYDLLEEMEDWYEKVHIRVDVEVAVPVLSVAAEEIDIAKEFADLATEWKEATWSISLAKRRIAHPAYLKIIGMGPVAIRLILNEFRREPDLWHYALESITRQNPVPEDADMKGVREAWLRWGERRGYCLR